MDQPPCGDMDANANTDSQNMEKVGRAVRECVNPGCKVCRLRDWRIWRHIFFFRPRWARGFGDCKAVPAMGFHKIIILCKTSRIDLKRTKSYTIMKSKTSMKSQKID